MFLSVGGVCVAGTTGMISTGMRSAYSFGKETVFTASEHTRHDVSILRDLASSLSSGEITVYRTDGTQETWENSSVSVDDEGTISVGTMTIEVEAISKITKKQNAPAWTTRSRK